MNFKQPPPLTFGFDIGIASVGWAVLAPDRIVAVGVRAFDKAEVPKTGESLNLARRMARLTRRRLRRRAWRLTKLARLLKRHGVIDSASFFAPANPASRSPWHLRVQGLDRLLAADEWARVLYHVCKHRGFHWFSRAEERKAEADAKSESGRVKKGLAETTRLMAAKSYRTVAEMVVAEFPEPEAKRNKQGEYTKALSRVSLGNELALLFKRQRGLGNSLATTELEIAILGSGNAKSGLFWAQKPALAGTQLLAMLGHCTFEKQEYRAPKAAFTAERHVWLTRLINLRVVVDGTIRCLTDAERAVALSLPYTYDTDLTYKRLRDALIKSTHMPDSFRFAGLSYPSQAQLAEGKGKDPESAAVTKLPGWHELRLTLKRAGLAAEWQNLATEALEGRPELLDRIAWVLSIYKDDDEVQRELERLPLPNRNKLVDALLGVRFDRFHALSLKALRRIVPHMERGLRYDEACAAAGYHHSLPAPIEGGQRRHLPPLYSGRDKRGSMVVNRELDPPRNPVVLRSLNQARKVMNALIRRYGSPDGVHIEMARDLSNPLDERRRIEREQIEYRERNEKDREEFCRHFGVVGSPRGGDYDKWRLYREQSGKCAYSLQAIDLARLLEPGYAEVDHALPYSRSYDDSKNNKVLALSRENREKGNRTPFEYLGGATESERWQSFVAFVNSNKSYRLAKRSRLLRRDFGEEAAKEFSERNLNDTRYICRFFKNYVERYLQLAPDSQSRRCVVLSGQLTSFLRARWGFVKDRAGSDRHHALDAAVVAACGHGMVKRLADYARRKELGVARAGLADPETGEIPNAAAHDRVREHFPLPWPHFRDEVRARVFMDNAYQLRTLLEGFGTYAGEDLAQARPLFVSRAPQRRTVGAVHKETVYGKPARLRASGGATERVPLSALTLADLDRLADPDRNVRLYAAIRERLQANGGKGERAFPAANPLRKPDANGNPSGPVVRAVTLEIDKLSGVPIRGGVAKNDAILRVDVFTKDTRYYLVPVYAYHRVAGLPMRAIVANADESQWTPIDVGFSFVFSLYPNDLVRVVREGGRQLLGYLASCDRNTAAIDLWAHDRSTTVGNNGLIHHIGVKTATLVERLEVDVLGTCFPCSPGIRRGLA